jgi:hypothetical protein
MNTQTLKLLRWHAGLDQQGPNDTISIAQITWAPTNQAASIDRTADNVIMILSEINYELNGPKPSQSTNKSAMISRQLIFAVEEIRRLLREALTKCNSVEDLDALKRSERRINCAWSGVVSGDIDNLRSYIDEQA